ncbi:DUF3093 domain-containing protein [Nocardioides sp. J2M5]|uniref:DUF3093 domain-containing protein n=1 Tax=Nocardioides palaemonis TaxID=2829810 RepID=UPI001BAA0BB1|nr:DUF3093 domain-containing protein [Nocardioides palaemonis]MBS2938158.1 DUF3093 domain-containing protein [Nocardioides palaemonis]
MDYAERLTVPLRWWAQGTMLVASLWLAVLAATPGPVAWSTTLGALALMVALFVSYGNVRVGVAGGELRAGRAHIPLTHVGEVVALEPEEMRRLAGRDADARAHLLLRPYVKRGVRVEVTDPADPTPYWLISCRRPDRLVSAVRVNHTGPHAG